MDRKQIEAEHIVARYLADQLSPEEAAAFEAYYTQHPSMVREIEYTLRLKEGLATLRDRQQLDALMKARRWRWALPLSIAAAVAVAFLGTWSWYGSSGERAVAASLGELSGPQAALPLGGKYLLVRVRGSESTDLRIQIPAGRSALELQVLPAGGAAGAPYRLAVDRLDAEGNADRVGEISNLAPGADGLFSAWLDSTRLQPGRHKVELVSQRPTTATPDEHFVIELVR